MLRSADAGFEPPLGLKRIASLSYGDQSSGNCLVEGDNIAVLSAFGRELTGRARCIYIDPPYNTAERWTHFEDRLDHGEWLAGVGRCVELLWPCLSEDGSLWISINDPGMHYLKVFVDELVGRASFVSTIVWQHRTTRENRRAFSNNHEYLLVYAKDPDAFRSGRNRVPASSAVAARYRNPDNDSRGPWQSISLNVQAGHGTKSQFYELTAPSGRKHRPPKGRCWVHTKERMEELIADGRIWFGRDGMAVPRLKRFRVEADLTVTPETVWTPEVAGTTTAAKRHLLALFRKQEVFDTPKPEQLIHRVLTIASDPGDLVLDAYLGSGTTAAVAHKMRRRWIGIECGSHAVTHCADRLRQVVDGDDERGISSAVAWRGGGGYTFLRHAADLPLAA